MAEEKKNPLITSTGVRNILVLAALGAAGYYVWRKWIGPKLYAGDLEAAGPGGPDRSAASSQSTPLVPASMTVTGTETAQKYAGTLGSPIVIPIGPYPVVAGKSYATPTMMMTTNRKVATKKQPQQYTYAPVLKTLTAQRGQMVRQFLAPVSGMFTGMLLSEKGSLWAEIKTA